MNSHYNDEKNLDPFGAQTPLFDYLCAIAHYIGGNLVISNERRVFDHPITPDDIQALAEELQDRGFRMAMVISFSLFPPLRETT